MDKPSSSTLHGAEVTFKIRQNKGQFALQHLSYMSPNYAVAPTTLPNKSSFSFFSQTIMATTALQYLFKLTGEPEFIWLMSLSIQWIN